MKRAKYQDEFDERVHRVGLAPRQRPALRTVDLLPRGMAVERIARRVESHVFRQQDRQILRRNRDDAAGLAMDDRDRAAPIALARNSPVAQLEIDLPAPLRPIAQRLRLEPARDFLLGGLDRQAVEETRIDQDAVAVIGDPVDRERSRIDAGRADDGRRAEPVDVDEIEVALVVRRAAENRARAVIHQDEIGDVDRQPPFPRRTDGPREGRCRSPSFPPSRSPRPKCRCAGTPR